MDLFEAAGYRVHRLDIIWDFVPCYANRKYYNVINYNGDVLKCTACNDLYEKSPHGSITLNGSIYGMINSLQNMRRNHLKTRYVSDVDIFLYVWVYVLVIMVVLLIVNSMVWI